MRDTVVFEGQLAAEKSAPRKEAGEAGSAPARAPARWRFTRQPSPDFEGVDASALLERLQTREGDVEKQLREAVADLKQQAGGVGMEGSDVKLMNKQEEEKISVKIMSELEFQRWERQERRHVAYSWGEAKEFLARRFQSAENSTAEETLSSLVEIEQGANSSQQAAFWRRQRKRLEAEAQGVNLIPKVIAHVCVQVDINLAYLFLPMVNINLGIMGTLAYNFAKQCWGWILEVGIGISAGIPIGHNYKLGVNVALVGTWSINEVPFAATGLKASDYKLPVQCSDAQHKQLTESGQKICHTKNPFQLIWHALQDILARASNKIFPGSRAKSLMDKEMEAFKGGVRTELEVQMQRWEDYKSIFKPVPASSDVGTDIMAVACLSVWYKRMHFLRIVFKPAEGATGFEVRQDRVVDVKASSQAATAGVVQGIYVEEVNGTAYNKGLLRKFASGTEPFEVTFRVAKGQNPMFSDGEPSKNLRCGLQVGSFKESVGDMGMFKYPEAADRTTIGGQIFLSKAGTFVQGAGAYKSSWGAGERAMGNALMDRHSNSQVRVVSWEQGNSGTRKIEGMVEVDLDSLTQRQTLTVPLGCTSVHNARRCLGEASLQIEPVARRGRLSLKCVRTKDFATGEASQGDPYCALALRRSALSGRSTAFEKASKVWRSSTRTARASMLWDEGTSFGIYSPAESSEPFPAEGPDGVAAMMSVAISDSLKDESEALEAWPDWQDVFDDVTAFRNTFHQDTLVGTAAFTWKELLGPQGFARPADVVGRSMTKSLGRGVGTIEIKVAWTPEALQKKPAEEQPGLLNRGKLAEASSGIFTAASQFLAKLPKYSKQVLERLMDDPTTDEEKTGSDKHVDCAERKPACPLSTTDGRSGARMHRQMESEDTVTREGAEDRLGSDDRVMNLAKAMRVSDRRDTAQFWQELSRSAANLFIRTVRDVQALFSIYFADEAEWDGECGSLKPAFELPYESVGGEAKGRPMEWRYKPWDWSQASQRKLAGIYGARLEKDAHILGADPVKFEHPKETFNPWVDYKFAYGYGYSPKDPFKTANARVRFLKPDSPASGFHGNFYFEGAPAPTVMTHLWCELAHIQTHKAFLNARRPLEPAVTKDEQRRRSRARRSDLLDGFVFGARGAPESDEGAGYTELVEEALKEFFADDDEAISLEKLTLSFDEACIDSGCGDRSDCERVRLKPAFLTLVPSLILAVKKYHQLLEAHLMQIREVMLDYGLDYASKMKQAKKLTLKTLDLVRRWLKKLGACDPDSQDGSRRGQRGPHEGQDPTRISICQALDQKVGILSLAPEFEEARRTATEAAKELDAEVGSQECLSEDICYGGLTLLDALAMDFYQAFAVKARLPANLQHTSYAQDSLELRGVLWEGLPVIAEALSVGIEKDRTVLAKLEHMAEDRVSHLAHHFVSDRAWRLQFPLIDSSFTLSLTIETMQKNFCLPSAALLWVTWSVHGQSRSWQPDYQDVTRCFSAKVHPVNIWIMMKSCGVLRKGKRNLWWPSFNSKDRDVTVKLMTVLADFKPDGSVKNIFNSINPQDKVMSPGFLTPANEAVAGLSPAAMAGTTAAVAGLLAGPVFLTAMALQQDKDPAMDTLMDAGSAGIVNAVQKLFKSVRNEAMQAPKSLDSAAWKSPESGEEWVEAEDPNRKPGATFGISEKEEKRLNFLDDLDNRHFLPHPKCNSLCGGRRVRLETVRRSKSKATSYMHESLNNRRLSEPLRSDQCAECHWQESKCDAWEVLDSEHTVYGKLCCTTRPCQEAQILPGNALPWCADWAPSETGANTSAVPDETAANAKADGEVPTAGGDAAAATLAGDEVVGASQEGAACCNTACGAKGFEDANGAVEFFVLFDDPAFLSVSKCGDCKWEERCSKGRVQQSEKGDKRLCCLKHACLGKSTGAEPAAAQEAPRASNSEEAPAAPAKRKRPRKVKRWVRHPGCSAKGAARPAMLAGRKEDRIGGTECGAEDYFRSSYAFDDPNFLRDAQGKPSKCAQCIWKVKKTPCADANLRLEDGSIAEKLVEQFAGSWRSRFHLCCVKLDCTPEYDEDRHSISDVALAQLGAREQASLIQGAPPSTAGEPSSFGQTNSTQQEENLIIKWVLSLTGTKHVRYFAGTTGVPPHVEDATKAKRTFWTWQAHLEAWHYYVFPPTPLGIATVTPTVALKLDWDLTPAFVDKINGILNATHQKRVKKCIECVQAGEAYCNRKYEHPHYTPKEHERCYEINQKSANECTQLVSYDDHGNPTSPRFLVTEDECHTMRFRMMNVGFKRRFGAVADFRDFRGRMYRKQAPLDKFGNSQDDTEGNAVAEAKKEEKDEEANATFSASDEAA